MTVEDINMVNVFEELKNRDNIKMKPLNIECGIKCISITNDNNCL
jgi:hypothetical protein